MKEKCKYWITDIIRIYVVLRPQLLMNETFRKIDVGWKLVFTNLMTQKDNQFRQDLKKILRFNWKLFRWAFSVWDCFISVINHKKFTIIIAMLDKISFPFLSSNDIKRCCIYTHRFSCRKLLQVSVPIFRPNFSRFVPCVRLLFQDHKEIDKHSLKRIQKEEKT